MSNVNLDPDICSCCGEIWNRSNLKLYSLGQNVLCLCPDCSPEMEKLQNIRDAFNDILIETDMYKGEDSDRGKFCRSIIQIARKHEAIAVRPLKERIKDHIDRGVSVTYGSCDEA